VISLATDQMSTSPISAQTGLVDISSGSPVMSADLETELRILRNMMNRDRKALAKQEARCKQLGQKMPYVKFKDQAADLLTRVRDVKDAVDAQRRGRAPMTQDFSYLLGDLVATEIVEG